MSDTCLACYYWFFDQKRRLIRGGWGDDLDSTKRVLKSMPNRERQPCDARALLLKVDPSRPFSHSYRTLKFIGQGAFGSVYQVRHNRSGEVRVSKEVLLSTLEDKEYGQVELQAMIMLDHPNILKLYEFFEDHVAFYIICELCTGGDFSTLCERPQDFDEIRLLYLDIFKALVYCHDQGVAHRDLKLENCLIYIDEKSSIRKKIGKVIDFGLAGIKRDRDAEKWMLSQVGTRFYIAPEIADKRIKYGYGCDIWAAGVMLYLTLTDEHPVLRDPWNHSMPNFVKKLLEYRAMRVQPLRNARISSKLAALLQGLLEREPSRRLTGKQVVAHEFFQTVNRDSWMGKQNSVSSSDGNLVDASNLALGDESVSNLAFDNEILARAKNFRQANAFEKAIMTITSYQEASTEIDALRSAFMKMDTTGNGTLSMSELEKGIQECGIMMTKAEVKVLFNALDTDKTGKVHFCEFLAGTLHPSEVASQKAIDDVFDFFDIDRSGRVSREELCQMIGDEAAVQKVLKSANAENSGYLSKECFAKVMREASKNMQARAHSSG